MFWALRKNLLWYLSDKKWEREEKKRNQEYRWKKEKERQKSREKQYKLERVYGKRYKKKYLKSGLAKKIAFLVETNEYPVDYIFFDEDTFYFTGVKPHNDYSIRTDKNLGLESLQAYFKEHAFYFCGIDLQDDEPNRTYESLGFELSLPTYHKFALAMAVNELLGNVYVLSKDSPILYSKERYEKEIYWMGVDYKKDIFGHWKEIR